MSKYWFDEPRALILMPLPSRSRTTGSPQEVPPGLPPPQVLPPQVLPPQVPAPQVLPPKVIPPQPLSPPPQLLPSQALQKPLAASSSFQPVEFETRFPSTSSKVTPR